MSSNTVRITDTKTLLKNNVRNYSMFLVLVLILVAFGILCGLQNSRNFWINFTPRNFTNIFFQYSYVLILATGMVMCIIILGIDLAVGSYIAMIGALSVMLYNTGIGLPLTVIASLGMGAMVGAFQGGIVAYVGIPPFIVTLAGMWLYRGLTYIITKITPVNPVDKGYSLFSTGTVDEMMGLQKIGGVYYPASFVLVAVLLILFIIFDLRGRKKKIENDFEVPSMAIEIAKIVLISFLALFLADRFARYRGLPVVAIVVGVTVSVFHFIMSNTSLGRYIYAVGGNSKAAKLSGINSEFVTFMVYVMMGLLAGLAAVVSTGYMNSALPQAGNGFEMDAIASCYIGGVSAAGGVGSVIGVVVGGLVMSAINNGMSLMNLGTHYQYVVKALILLLAVIYDVTSRRRSGLG
ncbi:MAG: sugar ABC transporter permease [Spirochaetaceae bacterium]|jgi:putative multiple sugar transport system permease protein|nr:sugar ABC transporter permease [Spirochaetaceae bacterium]